MQYVKLKKSDVKCEVFSDLLCDVNFMTFGYEDVYL